MRIPSVRLRLLYLVSATRSADLTTATFSGRSEPCSPWPLQKVLHGSKLGGTEASIHSSFIVGPWYPLLAALGLVFTGELAPPLR